MPRPSKGTRVVRERNGVFYIRTLDKRISTGTRDRREADRALARYIAERDRPIGPSGADAVTVAEVLDRYGAEHAPTVADTARIGYAILALEPYLGALPVSSLTGAVCRRYAKDRGRGTGNRAKGARDATGGA